MSNGKVLGRWPMGTLPDGTHTQSISRPALYGALRDEAVRRGVMVEYSKRLVAAENTASGVLVRFADGTTADADLLIGADGLHSMGAAHH
jgi:2-polyprenyl-6-methoxyphenol hydroxylase-like FAD-dependent oxidoreductase